jgi:RNA polymerase sigma-70 factor (ECF subfamily)
VTVFASFPVPHSSLITLTQDDTTGTAGVTEGRAQTADFVLHRVAQGDPSAVRECIDRFGSLIWSIARRMACTPADAELAVQEIFVDVWRSAGCFNPEQASEEVFITIIARRRLIDCMRRAARQGRTAVINDCDPLNWADPDNRPHLCAEALAATRAVMQLRPALRALLELGVLQGSSHSEIARELQLPLDTIKTVMRHALIQVHEFMRR